MNIIQLSKLPSLWILNFLNFIYGKPTQKKLFSSGYFNSRTWQTSFTITFVYLFIFFYVLLGSNETSKLDRLEDIFILILSLGMSYFLIKFLNKKYNLFQNVNNKQIDIYYMVFAILTGYFGINYIIEHLFIYKIIDEYTYEDIDSLKLIFKSVFIPLWLVWSYAKRGFIIYLLFLFSLFIFEIVIKNIFLHLSIYYDITYYFYINYSIGLFILLVFLFFAKEIFGSYKNVFWVFIFFTILIIIFSYLFTSYKNYDEIYNVLAIFLLIGILSANSISDLLSANVSRCFFAKMQESDDLKILLFYLFLDIFLAILFIVFSAGLIGIVVYLFVVAVDSNFVSTMIEYKAVDNYMFLIDAWIKSITTIPNISFDTIYSFLISNDQLYEQVELIITYYYFYFSVIIPTILHIVALVFYIMISSVKLIYKNELIK